MVFREFENPEVEAVFLGYPEAHRKKLLVLRELIFDTAEKTEGVGELEETLKWGEPSYLTLQTKSGSTVRINWKESLGSSVAIYFKCTTSLVETFKQLYPELNYEKTRAIHFDLNEELPTEKLQHCIALALTYHLRKKKK